MLSCCPTDDQAEVLVYEHIPRSGILGVAVPTMERARVEMDRLSFLPNVMQTNWYVASALFDSGWSNLIRQGQRPRENVFRESIL